MSSPSSCYRCSKPLAIVSPGGLCQECAATAGTVEPTSRPLVVPSSPSSLPTATAHPVTAPSTVTAAPAATTATGELADTTLPSAPAGYDLLDRLGSGGMGAVYLAREQAAERLVAMKFLHQPASTDALDRFLVELRVLARLEHPNIVRVLSSDFLRAAPYFTMEHLAGGSLARAIDDRPIPAAEAVRLVRTVADAVTAAHVQGIIHRDLKPSNILLTADGTPKVSDFGLAKCLNSAEQLTVESGALGTPSYMPPEQISRKNGEIGPWSDVYGLGATLYHLLAGRAPFVGETPLEIASQVLADPPVRLRALQAEVPKELEGIVLKCLEKDPKDRYQTVAELAADLDRFLAGRKPLAPLLTRWRRVKRWAGRHRWGGSIGVAIAVIMTGAVALGVLLAQKEKPRDYLAEYQRDLKAGKSVTLIPAKGLPAWYDRPIGGIEVGTDVSVEDACTVSSVQNGTLVLMPEMPIDRYTVEAEFCELRLGGVARNHYQWIGLIVGYDITPLPQGGRMHSFFTTRFSDFDVAAVIGRAGSPEYAICYAAAILETPGRNPEPLVGSAKYKIAFTPSPAHPGKWRKLKFAVEPTRLQGYWRDDTGAMVLFADLGTDRIRERLDNVQNGMNARKPPVGGPLPDWSPRKGIALWCAHASFGARNVVVTPTLNP